MSPSPVDTIRQVWLIHLKKSNWRIHTHIATSFIKMVLFCSCSCGIRGLVWAQWGRSRTGQSSGGAAKRRSCVKMEHIVLGFSGSGLAQKGGILKEASRGNSPQHQVLHRLRHGQQMRRMKWIRLVMFWLGHPSLQREVSVQRLMKMSV